MARPASVQPSPIPIAAPVLKPVGEGSAAGDDVAVEVNDEDEVGEEAVEVYFKHTASAAPCWIFPLYGLMAPDVPVKAVKYAWPRDSVNPELNVQVVAGNVLSHPNVDCCEY
ncbi:hypothetical protein PG994_002587 [Apiospora phragmitis]|uniref:Uncharacterized protein n=1 Tax=Apiospora phragmitis TaxID=2905665 RepID=A0ABR1W5M3_9PEZI